MRSGDATPRAVDALSGASRIPAENRFYGFRVFFPAQNSERKLGAISGCRGLTKAKVYPIPAIIHRAFLHHIPPAREREPERRRSLTARSLRGHLHRIADAFCAKERMLHGTGTGTGTGMGWTGAPS